MSLTDPKRDFGALERRLRDTIRGSWPVLYHVYGRSVPIDLSSSGLFNLALEAL